MQLNKLEGRGEPNTADPKSQFFERNRRPGRSTHDAGCAKTARNFRLSTAEGDGSLLTASSPIQKGNISVYFVFYMQGLTIVDLSKQMNNPLHKL